MTDDLKQLHAAPETIYLQVDPEGIGPSEWDTLDGATWCTDQINENDVRYVRADRIEQLEKERDEFLADAARYRWMRKKIGVDCDHVSGAYVWLPTGGYRIDEHDQIASDAAIDAAIAKLKDKS